VDGILFVHAHPDDETIGTGATMAHYAAAGVPVTLVTCTLGEEGEIHLPELAELAPGAADQLGGYRITELAAACAALGVTDHRFLGAAGRYRDSGMMDTPANQHPRCFWRADLDRAAGHLVEVMRQVRPQVLVTYDPNGFYGHPDHIQAHRTAMRAAELAAAEGLGPAKIYWTAVPKSVLAAGLGHLAESADNPFEGAESVDQIPFGTPDPEITARIDARDRQQAKAAAIRAHATQIPSDSWLRSLAGEFAEGFLGVEHYVLAAGGRGPGEGPYGWESDLFAGLDAGPGSAGTVP
jgi:N-acetyl-1-D-myo-inositol-2-amino-2-deoxy-alpha-D-glucopyranoside deacetylase